MITASLLCSEHHVPSSLHCYESLRLRISESWNISLLVCQSTGTWLGGWSSSWPRPLEGSNPERIMWAVGTSLLLLEGQRSITSFITEPISAENLVGFYPTWWPFPNPLTQMLGTCHLICRLNIVPPSLFLMPVLSIMLIILPCYFICYNLFKERNCISSWPTFSGLCRLSLVPCLKIGSLFLFRSGILSLHLF